MRDRHFRHYIFDHQIRERFDRYLERKGKQGLQVKVITHPFKGAGVHPVAVVRLGSWVFRLFYSKSRGGRWKLRSKSDIRWTSHIGPTDWAA